MPQPRRSNILSIANGAFVAHTADGGSPKRGRYRGIRTSDRTPVLISTRVHRDPHQSPAAMDWEMECLAPVLFFGPVDARPEVSAGASGFTVYGVVEQLPLGTRISDLAGEWSLDDCLRIGHGLCRLATRAAEQGHVLNLLRPETVFAEQRGRAWNFSGVTARSYLLLGHGGDARLRSPYRDRSYMAPEIHRGESSSSASDVFSIGLTLWELASGGYAFGESPIPDEDLAKREEYTGHLELRSLLEESISRSPDRRPTLGEFHACLDRLLETLRR
jgi:serine/threonine protein kinase